MLWNGMARVVDGGKNIARANAVYSDDLKRRIKDEFSMLCNTMVDSFAEALFDKENLDLRNPTSDADYKRAQTVLKNFEKGIVSESRIADAAFEALSKCPGLPGLLEWLLQRYGDEKGALQQIADAFYRPLDETKAKCLEKVWDDLDFSTEEGG